ncbi:MAG: energy transducer TonB [Tenacibaculum sp.]
MKTRALLLLVFLIYLSSFSQELCNSPEEEIIDPNSLSKCEVEEKKESSSTSRKIIKTVLSTRKKIVSRLTTHPNNINSDILINNDLQTSSITAELSRTNNTLKSNTILFNLVDEVPLFPGCSNKGKDINTKCFKNKMEKHFYKYFNPENIIEDEIFGKVSIKFDISIKGKVDNIEIFSAKKSAKLNKEIADILAKLPSLKPGNIKNLPVNVTYVFSINLTLD